MRDLFWLSDEAWAALEPHLPHNQPGKPRVDDRRVISGILHILKTSGRWRGGRTTKIHCLADGCDRIVAVALTPGNMADIAMAVPLLEALAPGKRLIADK